MRAIVIGNGESLNQFDFDTLIGERTYAVNRIWKLWKKKGVTWRPTDYVRCEKPRLNKNAADIDIQEMSKVKDLVFHIEKRLEGSWHRFREAKISTHNDHFEPCSGKEEHEWHFPQICAYGTVVTTAIQVAVLNGATEIYLIGCDLTMPDHFYGTEGINNNALALRAHEIAAKCCPVPIYNATIGGNLEVYQRKDLR